jgi:hypothetical protein
MPQRIPTAVHSSLTRIIQGCTFEILRPFKLTSAGNTTSMCHPHQILPILGCCDKGTLVSHDILAYVRYPLVARQRDASHGADVNLLKQVERHMYDISNKSCMCLATWIMATLRLGHVAARCGPAGAQVAQSNKLNYSTRFGLNRFDHEDRLVAGTGAHTLPPTHPYCFAHSTFRAPTSEWF